LARGAADARSRDVTGHAVVVGGSLTGLTAAAALARHFERVTLLERGPRPPTAETRKGVPQARHVRVLLKEGERILADLFPGLVDELTAVGSATIDMARDTHWFYFGAWKARFASGIEFLSQSRSFLEWQVRRRLTGLARVRPRPATEVAGLALDPARRVRGVRVGGTDEVVDADLVVDEGGLPRQRRKDRGIPGLLRPRELREGERPPALADSALAPGRERAYKGVAVLR
jgi:2-polyprenyl-6-methoxyphenol hydroxylase-like FAD-dependent oxidoreductase